MTKWQEFPIRPQGRPWVGINTRSGKLDDGSGQMTDSSINAVINQADQLAKRKGLIRGIDERFAGAVCGLHKYTDECGREWLLVADQAGISIRQPFSIPSFRASDAYPSDSFQADGPVDPNRWNNRTTYVQVDGSLVLVPGVLVGDDLTWFKLATNFSYQLEWNFVYEPTSRTVGIIKMSLSTPARLEGRVSTDDGFQIVWIDVAGVETVLGFVAPIALPPTGGNVKLSYTRDTVGNNYVVTMDVELTDVAAFRIQNLVTLNAVNDAGFGQATGLRLERDSLGDTPEILDVQGRPI
jgi:hypothetical protein